ncbi:MAG: mechanosensitive ion channel domain-containing protein [Devosia sp.]
MPDQTPGSVTRWPALTVWLAVAVLAFVCVTAARAQDLTPPAPAVAAESTAAPRQVSVIPAASDAQIATRLADILRATGWFTAPQVNVTDGVAFLDGAAETQERRAWAGNLAQNTEGVVAVVNRIAINADVGSTFDRALAESAGLVQSALQTWPLVLLAIVIIALSWLASLLVAAIARHALTSRIASPLLLGVVVRTIAVPVFLLGVYFVLRVAGLTQLALTLLGGTGLIGIIIGFAFRDIAENFLASLLLSMRNPFAGGDLIEVAGYTGIVQNLNTRSTVLLTLDGNHVQIPNATVYKSTIKNYSSIPSRRADYLVGIGYDSSVSLAQRLIGAVLAAHPAVLERPEPLVLVDQLGDATINLRIFYWFDSAAYSPAKINSALLRQTKNALLQGGIELPDPAREVVFPRGVPIVQMAAAPAEPAPLSQPAPPPSPVEETIDVTAEEGDLASESRAIDQTAGRVPESEVNLLTP